MFYDIYFMLHVLYCLQTQHKFKLNLLQYRSFLRSKFRQLTQTRMFRIW